MSYIQFLGLSAAIFSIDQTTSPLWRFVWAVLWAIANILSVLFGGRSSD